MGVGEYDRQEAQGGPAQSCSEIPRNRSPRLAALITPVYEFGKFSF
jgi:hypothetical protein